jgi:hypothetical protein
MSWMSGLFIVLLTLSSYAGQMVRFQRGVVNPSEFSTMVTQSGVQEWILLYTRTPSLREEASLASARLRILNYLPDDALVVRGNHESVIQAQRNDSNMSAVMPYPPAMKLAANLPTMSIFSQGQVKLYLVKTFLESDRGQVARLIQNRKLGLVNESAGNSLFVEIRQQDLLQVASLPGVEHVQEPTRMQTMEMKF